jgi:uncharacterized protein YndB with AHSA1/START domain
MNDASYTTTIEVDRTPEEVFDAVVDVRSWWFGDIEGPTDRLGADFTYSVPGIHWNAMRITELEPGRAVAWLVTDSRLEFTDVKDEWTGTTIRFDIEPVGDRTRLRFTHDGLVPEYECFTDCSNAWGSFVRGSLVSRIESGATAESS